MAILNKDKTAHTIYLEPKNLEKIEKIQAKYQKKTELKVSFNATINKIIEEHKI